MTSIFFYLVLIGKTPDSCSNFNGKNDQEESKELWDRKKKNIKTTLNKKKCSIASINVTLSLFKGVVGDKISKREIAPLLSTGWVRYCNLALVK